jgi:hypothetical protein
MGGGEHLQTEQPQRLREGVWQMYAVAEPRHTV